MIKTTARILLACSLMYGVQAAAEQSFTMHNRQASPWYTNNFGASAKDVFPTLGVDLAPEDHAINTDRSIGLTRDDVDFLFGGRIRQEAECFDKPLTLRGDYNDVYAFVRSKVNLDFRSQYGRRTYGKPAAQMHMRLTAFSIWDDAYLYTPILSEPVYFHGGNFVKRAEIDQHNHKGVVPLMYLEEGWMRVNFDSFIDGLKRPLSLQVGSFPFMVGRGVSLGDYFEAGVEAYGYERKGDIGNATQRPSGLLVSLGLSDNAVLEGYYSKWRKRSHGPDSTREEVRAKRLDRDPSDDPQHIQRGYGADADIYAVRLGYDLKMDKANKHKLYVEPYAVYVNAPELKVEFEADSSARYLTTGVMAEYQHGNWSMNLEVAGQLGNQEVHAIDRNHLVVDDAYYSQVATEFGDGGSGKYNRPSYSAVAGRLDKRIGQPMKFQSHVFVGTKHPISGENEYLPYPAYYVSDETKHINADRSIEAQGAIIGHGKPDDGDTYVAGTTYVSQKHEADTSSILTGNASLYGQYQFSTGVKYYDDVFGLTGHTANGVLYNANLPFGGQQRFRQGYKVNYKSVMAMFDVRYALPQKRMNFSFAAGYVGGDDYPFQNHTKNQTSHAFMPWRDANYVGRWVTSFVALYPRKLPRPMEMADNNLYAHNHYKTMQNLQYVGCGSQWYPFKNKSLMFELNAFYLWEAMPPHKWDEDVRRTFANNSAPDKEDSMYRYIQDEELHFKGSATNERASKRLGTEINGVIRWQPYNSLQFDLRAGVFLPGQLFRDIKGCPNINTRRVDEKGEWHHDSLGHAPVSGAQARVTYRF